MTLIDRDVMGLVDVNRDQFDIPEYADGWNAAVSIVNTEPTIDAVKIIRCKDCAWCIDPFQVCKILCRNAPPDYFCAYAQGRI